VKVFDQLGISILNELQAHCYLKMVKKNSSPFCSATLSLTSFPLGFETVVMETGSPG